MASDRLQDRITDQFSGRGRRSDVWRALELVVDTDAFLNLGYSPWYQPHVIGSSQRRLAARVGRTLTDRLPATGGAQLLDLGCGRGGPSIHLAEQYGFAVTGVDLVPENVELAIRNAREQAASADFVVADAASLPLEPSSMTACTAIDSLVYVPDRGAAFAECHRALESGGHLVVSDLVASPDLAEEERTAVTAFADAWDMAPPGTVEGYVSALRELGFDVLAVEDLTPNSVGRFRTWSALFLGLVDGPTGPALEWLLRRRGLDPDAVVEQVRRAHEALPHLRHALVVASA